MNLIPKNINAGKAAVIPFMRKLSDFFTVKAEAKSAIDENIELLEDIERAKSEWISAQTGFQYASEPDIIDFNIYNIKAAQSKYEFLIRLAKERGLKAQ